MMPVRILHPGEKEKVSAEATAQNKAKRLRRTTEIQRPDMINSQFSS